MERIRQRNRFQRIILLLLAAMVVGSTVLYTVTFSRLGFAYAEHILIPSEKNSTTLYTAAIREKDAVFTVTEEKTVTFQYGERIYGPYTAKEDPLDRPACDSAGYFCS